MIHVVLGIIQRDGKFLMGMRPHYKAYGGYWEFPGGKVEQNELPIQSLKRELYEELNINVTRARAWLQHQHTYSQDTFFLDVYHVIHFLQEPIPQENQLLRWISLPEMKHLPVLAGNHAIIEKMQLDF